jgi:hypothetical protein
MCPSRLLMVRSSQVNEHQLLVFCSDADLYTCMVSAAEFGTFVVRDGDGTGTVRSKAWPQQDATPGKDR